MADRKAEYRMSEWDQIEEGTIEVLQAPEEADGTTAYRVRAVKTERRPLFGKQPYFGASEGVSFAIPLPEFERFLAVYQHKDWWVRPAFGGKQEEIPGRTQLLILKSQSRYTVYLAVCGQECRADMAGSGSGIRITVASNRGNRNVIDDLCLIRAEGNDPYRAVKAAVGRALMLLGRNGSQFAAKRYPEMFEYFGWCSWDAFYHKVNAQGIRGKLDEFHEKEIPVKWVLIDDGWLDADYDRQVLKGLDADRTKFPEGLGSFVEDIKDGYGIEHVGVWHAVMGYWNGLEPGSSASAELSAGTSVLPDGRIVPSAEAGRAFVFYDKWHSYLKKQCGIDFVKVDGQSAISLCYGGMESYTEASSAVQKGLGASAAVHFDNRIINCMGMAPEDMWNRESSVISRSSDDFVPEVEHGFREHAVQNAYNSMLQGEFFMGDWDMFWSSHAENRQNAILRAASGGPVYTSDAPGATDASCILPLILKTGRVLRCDEAGRPSLDCLFYNPVETPAPLKIVNRCGRHFAVAALNIYEGMQECSGRLTTADYPELNGKEWYVYAHTSGTAGVLTENQSMEFTLPACGSELFLLLEKREGCQVLGLLDKYISPATVTPVHEECGFVSVILEQEGRLGIFFTVAPVRILVNGREAAAEQIGNSLYGVECRGEGRLTVDIYTA